jgi:homoserine kinase
MKIKVFAPASAANFIVGFDTLGVALSSSNGELFGDIVILEEKKEFFFEVTGSYAHKLPSELNDNVVIACCDIFHKYLAIKGKDRKCFSLQLEKRLPVGSGLGSSASSIVATLLALNKFYDEVFTIKELLLFAGKMEGTISGDIHYDNVAPSLRGGLQLMIPNQERISETLPFFEDWFFVIYYPGIQISTRHAREILPAHFDRRQATHYWQNLASLIHGLYQKDKELIKSLLQDDLIEPYRLKLIPGFENIRSASFHAGAIAFSLSGSGSACMAICDSIITAKNIQAAIESTTLGEPESFCQICTLDKQGARLLNEDQ